MRGVSVIMPAYNAAATIKRALDSVAAQNYENLEVVVVDDGSSDNTADVAAAHPLRPIVVRQANKGCAGATNTAFRNATKELYAFLDADDEWLPGKLAAQVPVFDDEQVVMSATAFRRLHKDRTLVVFGTEPFEHSGTEFWRNMLTTSPVKKSSSIIRRSTIERVGGCDEKMPVAVDQELFFRVALEGAVAYLPEIFTLYHMTQGSLMLTTINRDRDYVIPLCRRQLEMVKDRMSPREQRAVLARRYSNAAANALRRAPDQSRMFSLKALSLGDRPLYNLDCFISSFALVKRMKKLLKQRSNPTTVKPA